MRERFPKTVRHLAARAAQSERVRSAPWRRANFSLDSPPRIFTIRRSYGSIPQRVRPEDPSCRTPARKLDLRKTLFLLPNIITLSSVFCGFDSIRISATAQGDDDYYRGSLLLVFALFFDMLDGRVARLTKTQSAFGLQIDSLADVISFGVAPALLVYKWSLWQRPTAGLVAAFLFAAAGAVRLARFNVLSMGESGAPTKPGKYIVGLPVPGAAGILISLVLAEPRDGRRAAPARARGTCGR